MTLSFEVPDNPSVDWDILKNDVKDYINRLLKNRSVAKKKSNDAVSLTGDWRKWKLSPDIQKFVDETDPMVFDDDDPFYKNALEEALLEKYGPLS